MHPQLDHDRANIDGLLDQALTATKHVLAGLDARPVGAQRSEQARGTLPETGLGAAATLAVFNARYAEHLSGSAGPRYFGYVTGGVTPAALIGDWLTSVYDQNAIGSAESASPLIELEALAMLRELFGLPAAYTGSFVSGATMSNLVGLAQARQWLGQQRGVDVAQHGLAALGPLKVLSGTPHSSVYKALAILGMGRESLETVPTLPDREAIDLAALAARLQALDGQPLIVVANSGTVNTVDFDDLAALAALKQRYGFWLHIDAAFGGFAACATQHRHLLAGLDAADSLTIDAHKWLNVPYDSAMQFSRHPQLQFAVFQNAAAYLRSDNDPANFINMTTENSRRLRALAAWFTLTAYGRDGYAAIVETACNLAAWLGAHIAASPHFQLLAPQRLNGLCFTLMHDGERADSAIIQRYLHTLQAGGEVFLTPTVYNGSAAVRVSITNWRTTAADVARAWAAMEAAAG